MPDTSIIIERPSKLALGDKGFRDIVDAPKKTKREDGGQASVRIMEIIARTHSRKIDGG